MNRLATLPALAAAINLGGTVMAMHVIGISLEPSLVRELDMQNLLFICSGAGKKEQDHQPLNGPCHSSAISRRSAQFSDNTLRSWAWSSLPLKSYAR